MPEGLIYITDNSTGAYNPETGVWTIGDIASGETTTIWIETLVDASNVTIVNNVKVKSDTYDPDESNNHNDDSLIVVPEADLEITKSVSNTIPHKNDNIIWTITVKVFVDDIGQLTNNLTVVGPHGTNATVDCTICRRFVKWTVCNFKN